METHWTTAKEKVLGGAVNKEGDADSQGMKGAKPIDFLEKVQHKLIVAPMFRPFVNIFFIKTCFPISNKFNLILIPNIKHNFFILLIFFPFDLPNFNMFFIFTYRYAKK